MPPRAVPRHTLTHKLRVRFRTITLSPPHSLSALPEIAFSARLEGALAETKKKVVQVQDKLVAAGEMRKGIDEKREQYRPIATRGAVLYFTVVDLSLVNVMYQTSLDQFQTLFIRYCGCPVGLCPWSSRSCSYIWPPLGNSELPVRVDPTLVPRIIAQRRTQYGDGGGLSYHPHRLSALKLVFAYPRVPWIL